MYDHECVMHPQRPPGVRGRLSLKLRDFPVDILEQTVVRDILPALSAETWTSDL